MIDLGTLAGLHEHRHQLAAYCARCDRWRTLPLADRVAADHGAPATESGALLVVRTPGPSTCAPAGAGALVMCRRLYRASTWPLSACSHCAFRAALYDRVLDVRRRQSDMEKLSVIVGFGWVATGLAWIVMIA